MKHEHNKNIDVVLFVTASAVLASWLTSLAKQQQQQHVNKRPNK